MNLPEPFRNFVCEQQAGEYKDFHVAENDPYPIKGVTYPTEYGYIPGYLGEDGHDLDMFKGTGNLLGFLKVWRPDVEGEVETKILVDLTEDEEEAVFRAFAPVMRGHERFKDYAMLVSFIEKFKISS